MSLSVRVGEARPIWFEVFVDISVDYIGLPLLNPPRNWLEEYYVALVEDNPGFRHAIQLIQKSNYAAIAHLEHGRIDHCVDQLEEGLRLRKRIFDTCDPEYVLALKHFIISSNHFAIFLLKTDKHALAFNLLKRVERLVDMKPPLPERELFLAILYNNMANYFYRRGKQHAARTYLEQSLPLWDSCGLGDWEYVVGTRLAALLLRVGKHDEAEKVTRGVLSMLNEVEDVHAENPPPVVSFVADTKYIGIVNACRVVANHNIAVSHIRTRRFEEAIVSCEEAIALASVSLAEQHRWMKQLRRSMDVASQLLDGSQAHRARSIRDTMAMLQEAGVVHFDPDDASIVLTPSSSLDEEGGSPRRTLHSHHHIPSTATGGPRPRSIPRSAMASHVLSLMQAENGPSTSTTHDVKTTSSVSGRMLEHGSSSSSSIASSSYTRARPRTGPSTHRGTHHSKASSPKKVGRKRIGIDANADADDGDTDIHMEDPHDPGSAVYLALGRRLSGPVKGGESQSARGPIRHAASDGSKMRSRKRRFQSPGGGAEADAAHVDVLRMPLSDRSHARTKTRSSAIRARRKKRVDMLLPYIGVVRNMQETRMEIEDTLREKDRSERKKRRQLASSSHVDGGEKKEGKVKRRSKKEPDTSTSKQTGHDIKKATNQKRGVEDGVGLPAEGRGDCEDSTMEMPGRVTGSDAQEGKLQMDDNDDGNDDLTAGTERQEQRQSSKLADHKKKEKIGGVVEASGMENDIAQSGLSPSTSLSSSFVQRGEAQTRLETLEGDYREVKGLSIFPPKNRSRPRQVFTIEVLTPERDEEKQKSDTVRTDLMDEDSVLLSSSFDAQMGGSDTEKRSPSALESEKVDRVFESRRQEEQRITLFPGTSEDKPAVTDKTVRSEMGEEMEEEEDDDEDPNAALMKRLEGLLADDEIGDGGENFDGISLGDDDTVSLSSLGNGDMSVGADDELDDLLEYETDADADDADDYQKETEKEKEKTKHPPPPIIVPGSKTSATVELEAKKSPIQHSPSVQTRKKKKDEEEEEKELKSKPHEMPDKVRNVQEERDCGLAMTSSVEASPLQQSPPKSSGRSSQVRLQFIERELDRRRKARSTPSHSPSGSGSGSGSGTTPSSIPPSGSPPSASPPSFNTSSTSMTSSTASSSPSSGSALPTSVQPRELQPPTSSRTPRSSAVPSAHHPSPPSFHAGPAPAALFGAHGASGTRGGGIGIGRMFMTQTSATTTTSSSSPAAATTTTTTTTLSSSGMPTATPPSSRRHGSTLADLDSQFRTRRSGYPPITR